MKLGAWALFVVTVIGSVSSQEYMISSNEDGSYQVWGHEVKLRNQPGVAARSRSWVDRQMVLPAGRLLKFSLYHVNSSQPSNIRLQIWKYWSGVDYQLLYEQIEVLPKTEGILTAEVADTPSMASGMRMGWTLEADYNPIAYDFVLNYKQFFRQVENGQFPVVGENYTFQSLAYPALYSVQVAMDTRIVGATGATGATGPAGPIGPRGDMGPKGDVGNTGPQGLVGATGSTGPVGPIGQAGVPGRDLVEIDECAKNTDECDQLCVNTIGSYRCECTAGYKLEVDGRTCSDFDECTERNGGCSGSCENSVGSYTCVCPAGFTLSANLRGCDDINECSTATCVGVCINTWASGYCLGLGGGVKGGAAGQKSLAQLSESELLGEETSVVVTGNTPDIMTVWMCALTLVLFIVMGANFRRWRLDYCKRRQDDNVTTGHIAPDDQSVSEDRCEIDITDYVARNGSLSGNSLISHGFSNDGFSTIECETGDNRQGVLKLS